MLFTRDKNGNYSYPEEMRLKFGRSFRETFDNLGIEYYVDDSNVFFWEEEPDAIQFLKERARLAATVDDQVYGRETFYPGIKRTFIYEILPKKKL
jgi:hypothetical protein